MKKFFLLMLCVLVVGLPVAIYSLLDEAPALAGSSGLSADQADLAKAIVERNDPRSLAPGEIVTRWLDEAELTLMSAYALSQLEGGAAAIELHPGRAYVQFSVPTPAPLAGRWVNGTLVLLQQGAVVSVDSLSVGWMTMPGPIANQIIAGVDKLLRNVPEYVAALESLNGLQIVEDRMVVVFQWRPELVNSLRDRGRDMIVDEATRERLIVYSRQVQGFLAQPGLGRELPLVDVMQSVFQLADARGGDPVAENRAAILALSFYFGGVSIDRMLGVELPSRTPAANKRLTLAGRYDFTQHFLTSAALTVAGSGQVADFVGLFKELDDAGGGSGFSFTDLGADRAGVRFAEFATANAATAKRTQREMLSSPRESLFFPNFLDLPELLANDEFESRFGGVGSPAYNEVVADIENRLASVSLYEGNR